MKRKKTFFVQSLCCCNAELVFWFKKSLILKIKIIVCILNYLKIFQNCKHVFGFFYQQRTKSQLQNNPSDDKLASKVKEQEALVKKLEDQLKVLSSTLNSSQNNVSRSKVKAACMSCMTFVTVVCCA